MKTTTVFRKGKGLIPRLAPPGGGRVAGTFRLMGLSCHVSRSSPGQVPVPESSTMLASHSRDLFANLGSNFGCYNDWRFRECGPEILDSDNV